MTLRVIVADDQEMVRSGIRMILETHHIEVVGEAADGRMAVELAQRLRPEMLARDRDQRQRLFDAAVQRMHTAAVAQVARWRSRLEATERLRQTLGYQQTLQRGYAVVRGDGAVVASRADAERAVALEIQFHDGRLTLPPRGPRKGAKPGADQGSLF